MCLLSEWSRNSLPRNDIILRNLNPFYIVTQYFSKIYIQYVNIIASTPRFSSVVNFGFYNKNLLAFLVYIIHATRSPYRLLFDLQN